MKSDAKRQAEYQARQASKGKTRLNCWIAVGTKKTIDELAQQHGKTIADVIDLGVAAARAMLGKPATRPPRVIIQQRPAAPTQPVGNTTTPAAPESAPTAPQHEPEQAADDDVDARIRAAATSCFTVAP